MDRRFEARWRGAKCIGLGHIFFSDDPADVELAKAVCRGCALVRPCLVGAVARGESCGVWGGELIRDGRILAQTPRRGRPSHSTPVAMRR